MGIVATTLSFSADTSLISSTSHTDPSRVLLIMATISSLENSICLFILFVTGWLVSVGLIIKQSIYLTIPSAKPDTMLTREPIVKKEQIACSTKARLAR